MVMVPLSSLQGAYSRVPKAMHTYLDFFIKSSNSSLFQQRTVREILWGYPDPMLKSTLGVFYPVSSLWCHDHVTVMSRRWPWCHPGDLLAGMMIGDGDGSDDDDDDDDDDEDEDDVGDGDDDRDDDDDLQWCIITIMNLNWTWCG